MDTKTRQQRVVTLYHLMRESNELLREFSKMSPEAFSEIYEKNKDFVDALEEVLFKHNLMPGSSDKQH